MTKTTPPLAAKKPVTYERHGVRRCDDYGWLRDDNWAELFHDTSKLDPAIAKHLAAENLYQATFMADTVALQKTLLEEMKGRIKQDDCSVPYKDGAFAYGRCYEIGDEQPRFFRTPREGGARTVYLDGNAEAQDTAYFRLSGTYPSPDHSKFVWGYDDKGSEFYRLKIRDFGADKDIADRVVDTGGAVAWDGASAGFFYTKLDANHRADKVYYHCLGSDQTQDVLIYEERDPGFFTSVSQTLGGDFIMIEAHDHETSEVWLISANAPLTAPRLVRKREKGVEYSLAPAGDVAYILTNIGGARDFKIIRADLDKEGRVGAEKDWQEVVAHQEGQLILEHQAYQDYLVFQRRIDGLAQIIIIDRHSGGSHVIKFDEEVYDLSLVGSAEYASRVIRFRYASMTTPSQLFDYDMGTGERTLLKTQEVPSGHRPADYVTRRLMVPAQDGALIPISLLYHKSTPLDGSSPCLLYGYGAYGITIEPSFSTNILSLVDRGFLYAIAHIRGGKEKGFAWYEQGKHRLKTNTFDDFIAVGRYLVSQGLTRHDRLIAEGGSAGGMLMGAIANQAPQDYAAIVAIVPFVDVLGTMLDASLPLTPPEWPEWGNPIENADDYALIASYSPYDNVRRQAYPPILAIAGLTDPRVTYWEPAKWVAKLRELKSDDNPVLLRINMEAGHGGASGRFSRLEEIAYIYAFMLKIIGCHQRQ